MEVLVVPADAGQPEGAEVVRKTASLPGERQRLLHEAEVLHAAGERGVEGLAAIVSRPSPDATEPCLVTAAVTGPSLAVAAPLPVLEVAGVVAEVARLLAGLHEAGLVHGAVEPGHVVLDGAGGAILVGLGRGGPAGAPSSGPGAENLDPAADVAGWGALVGHLLDRSAPSDEEPLAALRLSLAGRASRRGGRRRPPPRPDDDERRVLAALADQAQDPDPARRPAARSLAAAVTHRIPAARMPGAVELAPPAAGGLLERLAAHVTSGAPPGPAPAAARRESVAQPGDAEEPGTSRPARPLRQGRAGRKPAPAPRPGRPAAASARGRKVGPGAASRSGEPDERQEAPGLPRRPARARPSRWVLGGAAVALILLGAPAAVARLRTTEPPASAAPSSPPQPPPVCPAAVPPAADVDGDGCEEPVRWGDGVLQAGSARFALGGPGDAWAVGDWDCDGRRTPALLHDGALDVFDEWPAPGAELQGRQVANVVGAAGLTVVPTAGGCERPSLGRPGQADVVVDARRAP